MKINLGRVSAIEPLNETHHIRGTGDKAEFEVERIGWSVFIGQLRFSFHSEELCPVSVGDLVEVHITPSKD